MNVIQDVLLSVLLSKHHQLKMQEQFVPKTFLQTSMNSILEEFFFYLILTNFMQLLLLRASDFWCRLQENPNEVFVNKYKIPHVMFNTFFSY